MTPEEPTIVEVDSRARISLGRLHRADVERYLAHVELAEGHLEEGLARLEPVLVLPAHELPRAAPYRATDHVAAASALLELGRPDEAGEVLEPIRAEGEKDESLKQLIDDVDEMLTLTGLRLIFERNL